MSGCDVGYRTVLLLFLLPNVLYLQIFCLKLKGYIILSLVYLQYDSPRVLMGVIRRVASTTLDTEVEVVLPRRSIQDLVMLIPHIEVLAKKRIVLASQSPRRREILTLLGLTEHVVKPSKFDERVLREMKFASVTDYVRESARRKALDVAQCEEFDLLIAADTIVVLKEEILEKPKSKSEATEFLNRLSGRKHSVLTGVCLRLSNGEMVQFVESTIVEFAELNKMVIEKYVESGEPLDKAGAYGIQGIGGSLVKRIEGCYFNVMGLPMHRVAKEIANMVESAKL